jgi:hypothetical protein
MRKFRQNYSIAFLKKRIYYKYIRRIERQKTKKQVNSEEKQKIGQMYLKESRKTSDESRR